jgi:hypothetical protein
MNSHISKRSKIRTATSHTHALYARVGVAARSGGGGG